MSDTVTKLMALADEYAGSASLCEQPSEHTERKRQALQDELVRLFTPLTDEPVHQHKWFKTGAMEPGEWRCIDCGKWGKEKLHGIIGESK